MGLETIIVDYLISPLKDLYKNSVEYVFFLGENVDSLIEQMRILKSKRDDIVRAVEAAERQGLQRTSQVKLWLESVKALERDVSRIDTQFQSLSHCLGNCPLNVFTGGQLSKNAKQMLTQVNDMINSGSFSVVADDLLPVCAKEMPNASTKGVADLLTSLDSLIRGTEVGIVGVHGMGGVGKTTLLNSFNNKLRMVPHNFDLIMSIEVTEKVDVEKIAKIQRMIVSRLALGWKDDEDVKERASRILQALSRMKFLIMLDDVWEPVDLSSLGIPAPKIPYDSKLVVASRVEDVCTRMEAQSMIKIKCLEWDEAWSLFLERAQMISPPPEIEHHAKAIVHKCGGLPVALTTVGLAMSAKKSEPEWRFARRALYYTPADIQGMERDVLLRLKRSYDNLPDERLRLCFLYFFLYKEGGMIYAKHPVGYWIGEALIDDFDDICFAYVEGYDIVCRLKMAGLLESVGGDNVKLHGMIHSMAKWVASECGKDKNKWLVQPGFQLTEAPELERWVTAERISLTGNYISSISVGVPNCSRLVSLLLNDNNLLCSIPDSFFKLMPSLRVLDLSNTHIEVLPPEVGLLIELRYLDLSNMKLRSVPVELGKLQKLRYLDLSRNPSLTTFPDGVLRGLSAELRVLRMLETYGGWTVGTAAGVNGVQFEELEDLKRLKMLMITVETAEALHRLAGSNHLALPTHTLHLRGLQGMTAISLPSDLGHNMMKLGGLCIDDSSDVKEVVVDDNMWASYLPQLNFLRFASLHNVNIIFKLMPSGCMRGLTTLDVRGCPKVEQLIGEVVETGAQDGMGERIAFPGLQLLCLIDLPELKSICKSTLTLPSLRRLKVEKCPKLKRLPFGPHSCRQLKEIHGRWDWWNGLEWEDDATRAVFLPLFSLPPCNCCFIHN